MKFTKEHYEILLGKIKELNEKVSLKDAKVKYDEMGLSHERFSWDVFFRTGITIGDGIGVRSNCGIVGDYRDSHIFTATKKAIKEVIGVVN